MTTLGELLLAARRGSRWSLLFGAIPLFTGMYLAILGERNRTLEKTSSELAGC
jgi:hypothetical protein